ncbi:rhodanese domain-containing protein CG4456 [Drosophila eugracilis]|uniref:rhodanese domain-containing protein CG4456 n=1 Tax=Drosophila eugracilis TaxID=29029 RepID=UPI0007E7F897|nr:rhodanese domain-containing protein CG4456 [Drosophila eugracilis]XP_017085273.1 rhodanese domain-containing protein CG4456 [Drosophila eugracilis]
MDLLGATGKSVVIQLANRLKFVLRPIGTMATYEQVKDVPNHPEVYLIDVRRKEELQQTGTIPASINIPLDDLEKALNLDGSAFKNTYGRPKPEKESKIIFTCRSGNRVVEAEKIAKGLGYSNVVLYKGSWNDWAQKEGL